MTKRLFLGSFICTLLSAQGSSGTLSWESLHFHLDAQPGITFPSGQGTGSFILSGLVAHANVSNDQNAYMYLPFVQNASVSVVDGNPEWIISYTPTSESDAPPSTVQGSFIQKGYIVSSVIGSSGAGNIQAQTLGTYLTYVSVGLPSNGQQVSQSKGTSSNYEVIQYLPFSLENAMWTRGQDGVYRVAVWVPVMVTASTSYSFTQHPRSFWGAHAEQHIDTEPYFLAAGL